MNEPLLAHAVPQFAIPDEFDHSPIPTDDTPLLTVLLPLFLVLALFLTVLLGAMLSE